jgi:hypothetical protein
MGRYTMQITGGLVFLIVLQGLDISKEEQLNPMRLFQKAI